MTLLDRLIRRPQPPRTAKAVTALGPWATGVPLSLYDREPQKVAAACLRAYKVGWFYKAGKKIADDVAALDWSISDGDVEEGEGETTLQRPALQLPFDSLSPIDQLQRLLERPNPYQTGRQLLRKTQVRLDFAGAAAWYLEGATSGLPQAIYGISPARMWPSRANDGTLLGWVMDKDQPSGGVPFDASEILWFSTGNADNDDIWGTSVVEAVYSQVPLTDLIARHTGDVLSLGGRLSGMLWPKGRPLTEDEYVEAQRAWRNVASDPNAARRMLIFPEPMEWAQGAATPQEIGIPELASLNRDEILTAFPISPYRLGVPMPGGLNSGELRKEDRKDYWEGSIHPRADLLEETIQVGLVSLYEDAEGRTFDFEIAEPNMDDAAALKDKADAYKELVSIGLDPKESLTAVGLGHIKWLGLPELIDPQAQAQAQQESRDAALAQANSEPASIPAKATKAREDVAALGKTLLGDFLAAQRDRVVSALKEHLPATKAGRIEAIKAPVPDWWDREHEDRELAAVLRVIYQDSSRQGLQVVANALERIVPNRAVARVTADLLTHGTERIADINARTLQAITIELAEGTRRGYSVAQLIDGVPSEGFAGVLAVGMENGVGVWGDARAEMIARTETVLSYNRATLDGYKEFRVVQVEAIDGDGDEECAARNGNVYAVDEALEIEDHPNGTLDWIPVVDKAWHDPAEQVERVLKAMPQPVYHFHVEPDISMPDITLPKMEPVFHVEPAPVRVDVALPPPPTRTVLDFDDAGKVIGSHEELVHG